MGFDDHADSYLVLLVRKLTGWDPPVSWANGVAASAFLLALGTSMALNLRDARLKGGFPPMRDHANH